MSPERIQLKRTKGWRKPEGAVVVARPTKWGNPWKVERSGGAWKVTPSVGAGFATQREASSWVVDRFRFHVLKVIEYGWNTLGFSGDDLSDLRGKDLCCWCPLDHPCHADVLLEVANR